MLITLNVYKTARFWDCRLGPGTHPLVGFLGLLVPAIMCSCLLVFFMLTDCCQDVLYGVSTNKLVGYYICGQQHTIKLPCLKLVGLLLDNKYQ